MMKTTVSRNELRGFNLLELLVVLLLATVLVMMVLPNPAGSHKSSRISCVNHLKQVGLAFRIWAGDNHDKYPMQVSTNLGGAMEFADEAHAWRVFQVMSNDLNTPKILICPNESDCWRKCATTFFPVRHSRSRRGWRMEIREWQQRPEKTFVNGNTGPSARLDQEVPFASNTNLSYFVGLDATNAQPEMFLSGDHNLSTCDCEQRGLMLLATNSPVRWTSGMHVDAGNILFGDGSVQEFSTPDLRQALARTGASVTRLALP